LEREGLRATGKDNSRAQLSWQDIAVMVRQNGEFGVV